MMSYYCGLWGVAFNYWLVATQLRFAPGANRNRVACLPDRQASIPILSECNDILPCGSFTLPVDSSWQVVVDDTLVRSGEEHDVVRLTRMSERVRLREERGSAVGSERIDKRRSRGPDDLGVIMILFNHDDDVCRSGDLRKHTRRGDESECEKKE